MKLNIIDDKIKFKSGSVKAKYPVIDACEINGQILVVYDYMSFPKNSPARNLFAYDADGNELWRAEDIGLGGTDAYTNVISESRLTVGNFAGYSVTIESNTGQVLSKVFTK